MSSKLSKQSEDFWKEAGELSNQSWVKFIDESPQILEFEDWNVNHQDSRYGKKEGVYVTNKTGSKVFLKLESKRLKFLLTQYIGKKVKLEITRFDSTPDSRNTWWTVEEC